MTDYDATIAHMKLAAMRELRKRAAAPFSIRQGDLPGFYSETLDAVVGKFAETLMAALIDRDAWKARVEDKQRQIERWVVSCNEVQASWEEEHRRLAAAEEALEVRDGGMGMVEALRKAAEEQGLIERAS